MERGPALKVTFADGWLVRGSAADNGEIKQVTVNGVAARAVRDNFSEWEVSITGEKMPAVVVSASDVAGNVEALPHSVSVK